MPQLEGSTTKNTQLCTGGLWGEKEEEKKDWQQMLAQMPIFKKKRNKKETIMKIKVP